MHRIICPYCLSEFNGDIDRDTTGIYCPDCGEICGIDPVDFGVQGIERQEYNEYEYAMPYSYCFPDRAS
jgi:transcription initiation factor TFIIIB Brf1 subunit/transcription initiation factor TFIIB